MLQEYKNARKEQINLIQKIVDESDDAEETLAIIFHFIQIVVGSYYTLY